MLALTFNNSCFNVFRIESMYNQVKSCEYFVLFYVHTIHLPFLIFESRFMVFEGKDIHHYDIITPLLTFSNCKGLAESRHISPWTLKVRSSILMLAFVRFFVVLSVLPAISGSHWSAHVLWLGTTDRLCFILTKMSVNHFHSPSRVKTVWSSTSVARTLCDLFCAENNTVCVQLIYFGCR